MRRELQRIASFIIVLLFSISFNFFLPRMMPGNPVNAMVSRLSSLGHMYGQEELVQYYMKVFALDGSMWDQFVAYLRQLMVGNLGVSYNAFPTTVTTLILIALPNTLGLMLTSTILSWVLGTIIGGIVGWRGGKSKISPALTFLSVVFANFPYFLLALVFVFLFAFTIPLFPTGGAYSPLSQPNLSLSFIIDVIYHALGPIIVVTLSQIAMWFLHMRALVVDIKNEDFMMYGEVRGLSGRRILMSYAIRNCLLPQVTELGMMLGWVFSGSLLTEIVFRYPGLGQLLFTAITTLDYNVIMGITLLTIVGINVALLLMDLMILPLLDPRVREE